MAIVLFVLFGGYAGYRIYCKKPYPEAAKAVVIGSIIATGLFVYSLVAETKVPIAELERNDMFSSEEEIRMHVSAGEEDQEIGIKVKPMSYSYEDVKQAYPSFKEELLEQMLGENESKDCVTMDLHFPDSLENYPYEIAWQTSDTNIVGFDGKLGKALREKGTFVTVRAVITDRAVDFEAEEYFGVMVYPKNLKEAFFERLQEDIMELQKRTSQDASFVLPTNFEDRELLFYEQRTIPYMPVFLISLAIAGCLVCSKRDKIKKEVESRQNELQKEYPKIVSKMAMLLGAGMTVSGAFWKIAKDGNNSLHGKNAAYKEMLLTCREMESGISDADALFHMGERTKSADYKKWTSFMIQFTKSGANGLKRTLFEEAKIALKERESRAKKLGEEAGTKLLFPMIMMLVIVMIIIMVPAFHSFQM